MARFARVSPLGISVQTGELDDNAVTLPKMAHQANRTILLMDATGIPVAALLIDANVDGAAAIALSKLATSPEANSTADQTDAEIETAYNAVVTAMSQAQAEAGTNTAIQRVTAQRIKQAIDALAAASPIEDLIADTEVFYLISEAIVEHFTSILLLGATILYTHTSTANQIKITADSQTSSDGEVRDSSIVDLALDSFFKCRLQRLTDSQNRWYVGLWSVDRPVDLSNGYGFRAEGSTVNIFAVNGNGTTATTTDTGITNVAKHHFKAIREGAEIKFYIDSVLEATHTTNLPLTAKGVFKMLAGNNLGQSPTGRGATLFLPINVGGIYK